MICASSPTASGQLSLWIETMPENKSLPVGAFASAIALKLAKAGAGRADATS